MRKRHYTGFWSEGAIVLLLATIPALLLLTGCNDSTNTKHQPPVKAPSESSVDALSLSRLLAALEARLYGASGNVQGALAPHSEVIQEKTKEEVEKLFRWEYRVADLPANLTASELEGRLAELGNEGWDCFSLASSSTATRAACKRRPKSALAYLKLIPGL